MTTQQTTGDTMASKDANGNEIGIGSVVTFVGRRRRYVIVNFDCTGCIYMLALSGAFRGSGPSGHKGYDLLLTDNQQISFSGAKAAYLRNCYTRATGN